MNNQDSGGVTRRWQALLIPICFTLAWALNAVFWKWPQLWVLCAIGGCIAVAAVAHVASRRKTGVLPVIGLLAALAFPIWSKISTGRGSVAVPSDTVAIRGIVSSEEQILALTPKLGALAKGMLNIQLPDEPRREFFAPQIQCRDLSHDGQGNWTPVAEMGTHDIANANVWSDLLAQVAFFVHAKFSIVKGQFSEAGTQDKFETDVSFSATARMKNSQWSGLSGKLKMKWERDIESDAWRIVDWNTKSFSAVRSDELWFRESLEEALPRSGDVASLRRSQHHEETIQFYLEGRKRLPHRYFSTISANQKPGIAVADIDSDGDDDIFVTVRRGHCKLLENQGNGTFLETASLHGLDVKNHCTSAIFADFDNDGDPDLMLGRSLLPCKYFENIGGWFNESTASVLPRLAISMSAADYDNDGLLDVYICTYRPAVLGGSSPAGGVASGSDNWPDEFLSPEVAKEYYARHAASHTKDDGNPFPNLLNQLGPPNVLLKNLGGGKFAPAPESATIGVWKNALQATWSDYDDDGDADLYVANDWAADHLFRNDGADGFTDVTQTAGTTAFGFAMGASWGDYDNDGRRDLYVTNMFSKAGQRITAQVDGLNSDYSESAKGNYLYRQKNDGTFDLVSGLEPPALLVAKAGWGWGGQFVDFNNDGWLDIYSINGYFSAPRQVATEVDL